MTPFKITKIKDNLTSQEAANLLDVSKSTLFRWLKNSELESEVQRVRTGDIDERRLDEDVVQQLAEMHNVDLNKERALKDGSTIKLER